jgi:hypothetical protein
LKARRLRYLQVRFSSFGRVASLDPDGSTLSNVLVAETRGKVAPARGNGWSGQREILDPHHVGSTFQVSRAKISRSPFDGNHWDCSLP